MHKALVIEDSEFDFELIKKALEGCVKIDQAQNLSSAETAIKSNNYDIIILDMMLPDGDGIELCSYIRSNPSSSTTPLLILSGKDEPAVKALGFQLGADDYITKPFHAVELRARVERKLQRSMESQESSRQVGPMILDCERMSLTLSDGKSVDLTPVEFKLLWTLSKRDGIIYSRPQLTEAVYGTNYSVSPRTIDSHVRSLRQKLGPLSTSVKTVQGVGYQFSTSSLS